MSCRELNYHFKEKHRKLQCSVCNEFFRTPSAYKLHVYVHMDGQYECKTCHMTSPFRSQLTHHEFLHVTGRQFKCKVKGCTHDFTHKNDLKKHLHAHEVMCMNVPYVTTNMLMNATSSNTKRSITKKLHFNVKTEISGLITQCN